VVWRENPVARVSVCIAVWGYGVASEIGKMEETTVTMVDVNIIRGRMGKAKRAHDNAAEL
jgi:hypothetical protein